MLRPAADTVRSTFFIISHFRTRSAKAHAHQWLASRVPERSSLGNSAKRQHGLLWKINWGSHLLSQVIQNLPHQLDLLIIQFGPCQTSEDRHALQDFPVYAG